MSFQDVRPGRAPASREASQAAAPGSSGGYYRGAASGRAGAVKQGGFGSAGPLRTGGVGAGPSSSLHRGGLGQANQGSGTGAAGGGSSGGGKVGDYLMVLSQNVTILNRMVQQLGTTRDTAELRGQCRCQLEVIDELRGKVKTQLSLGQQQAEGASRHDAARLGAMNAKLTKDFNRVNAIAVDLGAQAERKMREVDTQRRQQGEADEERAKEAFAGVGGGGRQQGAGTVQVQQRRERVQMQEEAINTAIIQETEEELQQINQSLYKVNEIYRDLANLVEEQQEMVEQIESNTEGAHARAQEGLVQVQKANAYQPSCTIS